MDYSDLHNFKVVLEENGQVSQINGNVVLQNILTQEMVSASYEDVAEFYNLGRDFIHETEDENRTEIFKWSDDQTNFLLMMYEENCKQIGPMKKFRTKKHMWIFISEACFKNYAIKITPEQVEGRFKTVIKKTKAIIKNNQTSGASRKEIPYASIMNNIIKDDDSLFPEIFMGPNKLLRKQSNLLTLDTRPSSSSSSCSSSHQSQPSTSHCDTENQSPNPLPIGDSDEADDGDADDILLVSRSTPKRKQKCLMERMVDRLIEDKRMRSSAKEEQKERRHKEKMERFSELGNLLSSVLQPKKN